MALQLLKNVNFGPQKSGLTGQVGYTILDVTGNSLTSRTTTGVYELANGSGIYAANVTFPDNFHGAILWDSGDLSPAYASEQCNVEENDPKVGLNYELLQQITGSIASINGTLSTTSTNIQFLVDMEGGRWRITAGNQMIFYKADNVTEVARFNLFDINGDPTADAAAERCRV